MPQPPVPPPKTHPKPKKLPLLPGSRKVQSLERMLDNTEHLDNERSVGIRSTSSPAAIRIVHDKGVTKSLPLADTNLEDSSEEGTESVPQEMGINSEDEDYSKPGGALEISMIDNIAYKKSTLTIEKTEAHNSSKTDDSAQELETEAEQEAQNTPIHSYDEPHVFW